MAEHDFHKKTEISEIAAKDIEKYLSKLDRTINVLNVEKDKYYQSIDVDLIWEYFKNGKSTSMKIEIKGDTYDETGNYFFETVSNKSKKTLGCFLYTECNVLFYYFVNTKQLHILNMPKTKKWFLNNPKRFATKEVYTKCDVGGYVTVGKLVPIRIFDKEIGVKIIDISSFL